MKVLEVDTKKPSVKLLIYGRERMVDGVSLEQLTQKVFKYHNDGVSLQDLKADIDQVLLEQQPTPIENS